MSFKCSYEFRMIERTLKTVLENSVKKCINIESMSRRSQFSHTVIVAT